MILWRNIEIYSLLSFLVPTPDFPHFYYMLGGNLGSLLYGDVSMMIFMVDTLIYMYQCMYVCTTFSREGSYYLPFKAIQFAFDRLYDKQNLT